MAGPPKPRRPLLDMLGGGGSGGDGDDRGWLQAQLDGAVDRGLAKVRKEIETERTQAQEKIQAALTLATTYMDEMTKATSTNNEKLDEVNKNLVKILAELKKMNKK